MGGAEWGLSALTMAALCGLLAHSKGRSVIIWSLLGFFASCFALIVLVFLSDLREEQRREEQEQRRRERDRQHDIKRSGFEATVLGRLDSHDVALGVDTRRIASPLDVAHALPISGEAPTWYYDDHGHPAGPISRAALRTLFNSGAVDEETLVWCPEMTDWAPLREALPRHRPELGP